MAQPILKWAGGKRQLLDELYNRFPKQYNHYHEPFFGGGALFFDLEPEDGTINDTNPRLMSFYRQIRDHPDEVIQHLRTYRDPEAEPDPEQEFSEEMRDGREVKNYYYQQRELFNKRPNDEPFNEVEEAALLLYLNRTCFNGLYRENSDGEFNVPIGSYANPEWVFPNRIREAIKVLKDTEIYQTDFNYILDVAEPGDVAYCDPPYEPLSRTADFTSYSAEGFGREDQKRLLRAAQDLNEQGVWVIMSNSGVLHDKYLEAGFHVDIVMANRAISCNGEERGEVEEIIATNVAPEGRIKHGQLKLGKLS